MRLGRLLCAALLATATASVASAQEPEPTSGAGGRVLNGDTGQTVAGAVVRAERGPSAGRDTESSEGGAFQLRLEPGRYSLFASADLHHGARLPGVTVRADRVTSRVLTLQPIDGEAVAEEVEIVYRADTSSASAQDQLRTASSGIAEGVGSAQMSARGASDAGSAAQAVVGVTLEGSSLTVRGLGGRYALVLLNGIQLPSTDPDVPSVDLDLLPTSVIERLQVSKAFLPNLPGNFAGGVLDIRTVRFPERFTFQLGAGVGLNTLSTFRPMLTYRGGDLDWLGFDDGSRSIPAGLDERVTISRSGPYQTFGAIEQAAERFENRWALEQQTAGMPFEVRAVLGDSIDLGDDNRLGFLLTASYDYGHSRTTGQSRPRPTIGADAQLEAYNDYELETGTESAQLSALGTTSLELGQNHVLSYVTLFNRSASDEASRQVGTSGELSGAVERWQLQFLARTMWFNQLSGDHRDLFGERVRLRWSAYGSYAARAEPDRRTVTYGPQGSLQRWLEKSQSGERFYSDLSQLDLGGTLDLRFPLWSEGWGSLGGHVRGSGRELTNRRFRMLQDPQNTEQSVYTAPVEQLFDAQSIGTLTRLQEFSRDTDSYRAETQYYAGYLMLETPIAGPLSFSGGARLEAFSQRVTSFSPFENERDTAEVGTQRTDVDVLPGAALRLEVAERMFVRAAYGMTVGRPQIRELAPYQYYDFVRDRNIAGNPDLARTLIQNADLRWEWFFGEGEVLALSAFYKYFDRPIELQIINQTNYDSRYINARDAHNVGGEAELRFNFRNFAPELSWLTFSGNLALIWSTVRLPDELSGAVSAERPLFNQAPYVANLSLTFDEPGTGLSGGLTYNVSGPRVSDVGTRANDTILPNIVRAPFHSLDAVVGLRFEEHFALRFKVRNLLLQSQDFYQGSFLTQRVNPGMSMSLGLTYSQ